MSIFISPNKTTPTFYTYYEQIRKCGTTLAAVSREAGLHSSTLANALSRPWPKGEWIIANCLKLHPSEIWPSRYFDRDGQLLERTPRYTTQK
ncbi:transcriptional regulator [Xenorhabdus mauleonii]|uniref:Transcriptional regulator n=1 Tax=Xenorhabdus mauleonii TaxID=351675 RepID=A0A1I3SGT6_9GAMM|nr:helix-turn-helix transcriptional regulator [Xenorhabdus mauleonii]PHM39184.1 transcriptional regulator [Xenorhabdus mauleonii]SFJ57983.1 Ner family transcriptional regulator [Xenorhabdus mauleonii]